MRCRVWVEIGSESSRSAGGAPTSFFTPSMVVVRFDVRLHAVSSRQRAPVQRVMYQLAQPVMHFHARPHPTPSSQSVFV